MFSNTGVIRTFYLMIELSSRPMYQVTTFPLVLSMIADNLSKKRLKASGGLNMLILTYFGLAPNRSPLLAIILCSLKRLSQSISSLLCNHAKAVCRKAKYVRRPFQMSLQ
jgi:hypothetical protein